ncbi:MAG: LVIVD repeat-containing protein [Candidatus Kariarchaeaceae archaeon]
MNTIDNYRKLTLCILLPVLILNLGLSEYNYVRGSNEILTITKIGEIQFSNSYDVIVNENHAYVSCGTYGLKIIDVSDPTNPTMISSLTESHSGFAHRMFYYDGLLYVGDGNGGLNIVDVTDPSSPNGLNYYLGIYSWDVNVVERSGMKIAYTGNGFLRDPNAGLTILNITDSLNPLPLGSIFTGGDITDLEIVNDYAYVLDNENGLMVLDVSNYSNPMIISQSDIKPRSDGVGTVEISQNYAYTTYYGEGLKIYDITDPSNLTFVNEIYETGSTNDVQIDSELNLAFVVDYTDGLLVFNISDPYQTDLIGNYSDTSTGYEGLFIINQEIYLNSNNGLNVLRFSIIDSESKSNDSSASIDPSYMYLAISIGMMIRILKQK